MRVVERRYVLAGMMSRRLPVMPAPTGTRWAFEPCHAARPAGHHRIRARGAVADHLILRTVVAW